MKSVVKDTLVESYLDVDAEIRENQPMTEYVVDIRNGDVEVRTVPREMGLTPGDSDAEERWGLELVILCCQGACW